MEPQPDAICKTQLSFEACDCRRSFLAVRRPDEPARPHLQTKVIELDSRRMFLYTFNPGILIGLRMTGALERQNVSSATNEIGYTSASQDLLRHFGVSSFLKQNQIGVVFSRLHGVGRTIPRRRVSLGYGLVFWIVLIRILTSVFLCASLW